MTKVQLATQFLTTLVLGLSLAACSDYEPVAATRCAEVVAHAQQVLGSMAPDYADLMSDCKGASDSERGCVMAASKKGKLAQCL